MTKEEHETEAHPANLSETIKKMRDEGKSWYEISKELETFNKTINDTDLVNQPHHYVGSNGLEVEVILKEFIPRYKDGYVAHRISSAIEYLLRAPLKNGKQDIEKAKKNLSQALEYIEEGEC